MERRTRCSGPQGRMYVDDSHVGLGLDILVASTLSPNATIQTIVIKGRVSL